MLNIVISLILLFTPEKGKGARKEEVPVFSTAPGAGRAVAVKPAEFGAKQPEDTLYYYNTVNYDALGLSQGGTYEAAIRLTPQELGPYANWKLVKVRFYHYEPVSHSGNIKIYAQGTTSQPGALITSQPYTAPTSGWITVTLSNPVTITGTQDIWVSVEITHSASQHPISVDSGPAVAGKGDFVYAASLGWNELSAYGLNYNWNIEAIVQMSGDPLDPLPPSNFTAYSDYTTPTSITLNWTDPTTRVNGSPIGNFEIQLFRTSEVNPAETLFVGNVASGVQTYIDTGLTDGVRYTYLARTHTLDDDSLSVFVTASWYAGGDPWPAPPTLNAVSVLNAFGDSVEVIGTAPTTQRDGTPLDDLAGIIVYVNGNPVDTLPFTTPGGTFYDTIVVTPGLITVYTTAIDNETPVHESAPSNSISIVTNTHMGGPDGFEYTFIDSDVSQGPGFIWIDASGGTPISLTDDSYITLTLPFAFPFYDQFFTSINLCSNGFLSNTTLTTWTNQDLPYSTIPYLIAFFWDDLNPGAGGTIRYLATQDYAVIHFENIQHFGGTGTYNMEVILYPNGDIAMSYLSVSGVVNSSTIGIQGNGGANNWYLKYTFNGNPTVVHNNLTIYWRYPHYAHDLALYSIEEPTTLMSLSPFNPQVKVVNTGQVTESNIDVEFIIRKGGNVVYGDTATISSINPGDTIVFTFNQFTPTQAGLDYTARATVLYADENPNNNSKSLDFCIPLDVIDFEGDNGGFYPDPGTQWEWGTPTSGPTSCYSGVKCWATVLGGNYPNNANWALYTPWFRANSDSPSFGFFHWYQFENRFDGGNVSVSINNGPYQILTPRGGYPDTVRALLSRGYTGSTGGQWVLAIFDLPNIHAGDSFRIKFTFASDVSVTYPGWYIDYFILGDFLVSSVSEIEVARRIDIPSLQRNDIRFTVNASGGEELKVSIYDVTGREVKTLNYGVVKSGRSDFNIPTTLPSGIYFLKVELGKSSTYRKIVLVR